MRNTVIPSDDELVQAAHRYLRGKHSTLWGRSYNVYDDSDTAAEFLAGEVRAVLREAWWPHWTQKL